MIKSQFAEVSMEKKSITHNNHYVPQFYLRNWSKDGRTIYAYNLLVSDRRVPYWKKESIKNAAVWHDLYTRKIGQEEIDDFETWFDREFESPAKPVFDKLLQGERITLSRFVAAQHIRTPARLDSILELERQMLPSIMEDVLQKLNRQARSENYHHFQKFSAEKDDSIPLKVNLDKENGFVKVETIVGKGTYLYAVKHLLTETIKHMYGHRWNIIHAANGISFPTSDDPVICLNYRNEQNYTFNGGWGLKHANIIMPISPKLLLFTEIGSKNSCSFLDNSLYWSNFFRKIIIEHAHRSVFADVPQKGMLAINPRIVSKELYAKDRKTAIYWHKEQTSAEDTFNNPK